jgi:hypothetical protein
MASEPSLSPMGQLWSMMPLATKLVTELTILALLASS